MAHEFSNGYKVTDETAPILDCIEQYLEMHKRVRWAVNNTSWGKDISGMILRSLNAKHEELMDELWKLVRKSAEYNLIRTQEKGLI